MMAESDNCGSGSDNKSDSGGEIIPGIIPAAVSAATNNAYPKTLMYVEQLKEGVLMRDANIKTLKEVVLACDAILRTRDATIKERDADIKSFKTEIEELKQTNKFIKYKYEELKKDTSAVTGGGSSIGQDEHDQKRKATSSDEVDPQKKKRKVTPKVIAQQELPPDAKEAFGDGKNKFGKYNKGNDFKVGTVNMAHDHGMRYKLKKMVTKRSGEKDWDLGGSWFLHKTKGVWEFMSVEVSDKLKKAQIESGEWKVLSC